MCGELGMCVSHTRRQVEEPRNLSQNVNSATVARLLCVAFVGVGTSLHKKALIS